MGVNKIMVYPYPTNITGLGELLIYANGITAGIYGSVMTFVFAATLFMILGADEKAFMTASFSGALVAMFMNILGIVNSYVIMIFVALTIGAMIWSWTQN